MKKKKENPEAMCGSMDEVIKKLGLPPLPKGLKSKDVFPTAMISFAQMYFEHQAQQQSQNAFDDRCRFLFSASWHLICEREGSSRDTDIPGAVSLAFQTMNEIEGRFQMLNEFAQKKRQEGSAPPASSPD